MATVKLALAELSIEEKAQLATNIESDLTGNADFPTPNPTLATLKATAARLTLAVTKVAEIRKQSEIATIEQDEAEDLLDSVLTQLGSYVENASGGDEAKILSAGMGVKSAATAAGMLPAPGPVAANTGDAPYEVDLSWPRLTGAKSFVIQYATDPNATDGDWKFGTTSTKSSCTVGNLVPGTRNWFRVAAVGSAGQSPWSSPVTARAI
ncbi:MAG: fibronectin type III domain-containing protein [Luteolibacter sp.]